MLAGIKGASYIEPYRLPTEAEWEYAARSGKNENKFPWSEDAPMSDKGCFYANFKPQKGNYVKDGNLITSRVGTYPPNEFGLYDMAGNVSEWTSTAYTEGGNLYTSDMNPDYRYNAAKEDPYRMKGRSYVAVRGKTCRILYVLTYVCGNIRMNNVRISVSGVYVRKWDSPKVVNNKRI